MRPCRPVRTGAGRPYHEIRPPSNLSALELVLRTFNDCTDYFNMKNRAAHTRGPRPAGGCTGAWHTPTQQRLASINRLYGILYLFLSSTIADAKNHGSMQYSTACAPRERSIDFCRWAYVVKPTRSTSDPVIQAAPTCTIFLSRQPVMHPLIFFRQKSLAPSKKLPIKVPCVC